MTIALNNKNDYFLMLTKVLSGFHGSKNFTENLKAYIFRNVICLCNPF